MTKKELIARIHKQVRMQGAPVDLTKKQVAVIVDNVFAEIGQYFVKTRLKDSPKGGATSGPRARAARGGKASARSDKAPRFTYPGFGTFTKKRRGGRIVKDPQTGAPIEIPTRDTVAFTPGVELKRALRGRTR